MAVQEKNSQGCNGGVQREVAQSTQRAAVEVKRGLLKDSEAPGKGFLSKSKMVLQSQKTCARPLPTLKWRRGHQLWERPPPRGRSLRLRRRIGLVSDFSKPRRLVRAWGCLARSAPETQRQRWQFEALKVEADLGCMMGTSAAQVWSPRGYSVAGHHRGEGWLTASGS